MEKQFGKYGERPWTGHANVQKLVADIKDYWPENEHGLLWNFLRVVHRDNNQLLHATVSGLASAGNRMDSEDLPLDWSVARADRKRTICGLLAVCQSPRPSCQAFELPVQGELDEMVGRQQYEFRRLTADEVKDVGRNDPCPCESGKKFKKCHEGRPLA